MVVECCAGDLLGERGAQGRPVGFGTTLETNDDDARNRKIFECEPSPNPRLEQPRGVFRE